MPFESIKMDEVAQVNLEFITQDPTLIPRRSQHFLKEVYDTEEAVRHVSRTVVIEKVERVALSDLKHDLKQGGFSLIYPSFCEREGNIHICLAFLRDSHWWSLVDIDELFVGVAQSADIFFDANRALWFTFTDVCRDTPPAHRFRLQKGVLHHDPV